MLRGRVPSRTKRSSASETGNGRNHVPVGQVSNGGSRTNSKEILLLMDNICTEGTQDQSVISRNGEALVSDVHLRRSY